MNALEEFILQLLVVADELRRCEFWTNDLGQDVRVVMRDPYTNVVIGAHVAHGQMIRIERDTRLLVEPMYNVRLRSLCCTLAQWETA